MTQNPPSQSYPEVDARKSFLDGLIGMRIADRYEVVRVLGQGGMGVVVEARHAELDRRVAIKFMFPEYMSNEVLNARFSREAKLAAKIQSPHIVRVSDVGRLASGVPYLVMDLLSGHDLGAELDEKGTLPTERAVDYVLQACAGIGALHSIGVVHRDLKPSNLFVADIAGAPTVMVLDFGISKDVTAPASSLTSTDTQLGTPMYMSPEQIRSSKNVDVRSDIWSLGVILYELLTGTLPFERSGNSIGELFAVILMTDPLPLCMRRPELPVALEEVVMRCLRRNSWDRYDSVASLAEALRPFARSTSLHRIDTVRRALGTAVPSSDVASASPPASPEYPTLDGPGSPLHPRVSPASPSASLPVDSSPVATARTTPAVGGLSGESDVKLEVDYVPPPRRQREPHASSSLVSSSRAVPLPRESSAGSRSFGVVWALGIGAAVIGAAATFAIRATSTVPEVAPAAASRGLVATPVAAEPTDVPVVPLLHVESLASPSPSTAPVSPRAALPPMRPLPVAPHPAASHLAAAPPAPPTSSAPAPSPPAPHAPSTDDLIQDRK